MRGLLIFLVMGVALGAVAQEDRSAAPWTRWWWHGSALTPAGIDAALEAYAEAGLGGVEIKPIYGVQGNEANEVDFLGPDWMALLGHTLDTAQRLGMGVALNLGTGWPYGGPQIERAYAAQQVRLQDETSDPGERFEAFLSPLTLRALGAWGPGGTYVDLFPLLDGDGRFVWTPPVEGAWTVVAAHQVPTAQRVKRAAPGGTGWVMDHYNRAAWQRYVARFNAAFAGHDPELAHIFNDSFEVYGANWTTDFFASFTARRGYRLEAHLDALARRAEPERVARIRYDYRLTVHELLRDEFLRPWAAWSNARGARARNQAHGSPGNLLDLYAVADIPETETFGAQGPEPLFHKFASSAAHLAGRGRVASETGTWRDEHFHVTLAQLKSTADDLFVSGVNQIIWHGTAYSPPDAAWPGWLFYASTQVNPFNPIWRDLPALHTYIETVQAALHAAVPDNPVLLYWPIHDDWMAAEGRLLPTFTAHHTRDWLHGRPLGEYAATLWDAGLGFDYVSDDLLAALELDGQYLTNGAARWRAVVVPPCTYMPAATAERLARWAQDGLHVVWPKPLPARVPGWRGRDAQLWPDAPAGARIAGAAALLAELGAAGIRPEPLAEAGLRVLRRQSDAGPVLLLQHAGQEPLDAVAHFDAVPPAMALVDALAGRRGSVDTRKGVRLQLAPGETRLLLPEAAEAPYAYARPAGDTQPVPGPWQVRFIAGGPALPESFTVPTPRSWTTQPAAQDFAGTARYSAPLDGLTFDTRHVRLDLGRVAQSARVYLDDKHVATLIAPPYRVILSTADLRAAAWLHIEVTSTAANRIRGMDQRGESWKIFENINVVNIDYDPLDASGWPLQPAGLLRPVTLQPVHWSPS